MDLAKYVSLLQSSSLFMARADKLGDPYEGTLPRRALARFAEMMRSQPSPDPEDQLAGLIQTMREWPRRTLVNCWYASNHESAAMWELYGARASGVAIRTTVRRLKQSLRTQDPIYIASVRYVDYDTAVIPVGNVLWPYSHKRLAFEHEHEVRAILLRWPRPVMTDDGEQITDEDGKPKMERTDVVEVGMPVPIDTDELVLGIAVAPFAAAWFQDVVQGVTDRYGLDRTVEQSDLGKPPSWEYGPGGGDPA
jgi:hypothetical protein